MRNYRLYIFRQDRLFDFRNFQAIDHASAIETAAGLAADDEAELWHEGRCLRAFQPPAPRRPG